MNETVYKEGKWGYRREYDDSFDRVGASGAFVE